MRGLRTDVLDGAGEGTAGYTVSCGDWIDWISGICGMPGEKGLMRAGSTNRMSAKVQRPSTMIGQERRKRKVTVRKETDKRR